MALLAGLSSWFLGPESGLSTRAVVFVVLGLLFLAISVVAVIEGAAIATKGTLTGSLW